MSEALVRLGPGVPDLAALGARRVEDLFGLGAGLEGEARAELVSERPGERLLRIPLPGTPDASGRVRESPRGAGSRLIHRS